jgi:hypothetical protein
MQQPIELNGGFYLHTDRAGEITGLPATTTWRWAMRSVTSYGFALNVTKHQGHVLVDERDVYAIAAVQRDFPLARGGPGSRDRREAMKRYADRVRATLAAH